MFGDPISALWWLTILKIVIGLGMFGVLVGSLYRFKKGILTVMGLLLISNLLCLYVIMGLISK
jgi:threonine/homoserine/homoserine lactone efflux protein